MSKNNELVSELIKQRNELIQVIDRLLDRVSQLESKVDELADEQSDFDDRLNLTTAIVDNHENEIWSLK